jgi:hypothetical protein
VVLLLLLLEDLLQQPEQVLWHARQQQVAIA